MRVRNCGPKLFDVDQMVEEYGRILAACALTTGQWNEVLEREFAETCGVRYAVSCSSGGNALMMTLLAMKQHRKIERVFVPANTHLATISPAMILGLEVKIVDVNDDMLMDLPSVVPMLDRNDVLIVVAIGGWLPEDLVDNLEAIQLRGATLLLDAAHAHGAVYSGMPVGSWGTAASFSFYTSKLVCGGEGGIAVTDDRELARELARIRDCGKVCQTYDEYVSIGMSSRLSNIMAMLATTQLRHLGEVIVDRQRFAMMYKQTTGDHARMVNPARHDNPNWYKFTIVLDSKDEADELEQYLLANSVELSSRAFPAPVHRQPVVMEYLGYAPECPRADALSASHLCLPGYVGISEPEVAFVCEKLRQFWKS